MAVLKEWRCAAHGPFEAVEGICKHCKNGIFVKQEIRTAPAYRRKNMKIIDGIFRETAANFGLTDLKNDVKSGESVLQRMAKTDDLNKPRWGEVPHAAPGFSGQPNPDIPKVSAESLGFTPTSAAKIKMPGRTEGAAIFDNALAKTVIHGHYSGE
jgi:hypothetical protein